MEGTGIQPVMPMGNGGFGDGWMGIFGLLVLLGILNGGGGFFGGNGNSNAIQNDINRGFDNQNLQAQSRDIMNASATNAANVISTITNGNASIIREFGNVETALTSLTGQMQNCCCENRMAIMQSNYDGAIRDAATNANITAQIQSVKDMIAQDKVESLQQQLGAMQLQLATSNVLRFPNSWAFNGGVFPPVVATAA